MSWRWTIISKSILWQQLNSLGVYSKNGSREANEEAIASERVSQNNNRQTKKDVVTPKLKREWAYLERRNNLAKVNKNMTKLTYEGM